MIPEKWQWLYSLNPMAGVVSGFRWALLGKPETIALTGCTNLGRHIAVDLSSPDSISSAAWNVFLRT